MILDLKGQEKRVERGWFLLLAVSLMACTKNQNVVPTTPSVETEAVPTTPGIETLGVLVWRKNQIFSVAISLFIQAAKAMARRRID